ncbi:hypothetical protein OGAPHI_000443 [Ogataea philodendri]|uniref:ATPase-stabilizing factor 15 kDa protein n=1 Tax=Ogataea philodendri TaxID=1378263 RepID=A0A9P8PGC8_9ASCO|nr:uncharacterized protein OGAPHI_000443 [Ogataea philodendri]KAH3671738.1 hypothetical protein OGAPHI_000443 [Ogataea philodendri]
MARTQKWNDKGSNSEPRYFTHNGFPDQAPNHIKKGGFGKGNWGKNGDELEDLITDGEIPPVFKKERRSSNHSQNEEKFHEVQLNSVNE